MPTSPSRKLSARYSRPLGVNDRSAWGVRAADFGISALRGHGPIAVSSLNFGEIGVSNATAFAATPINTTVTAAGVGSATIVSNNSNGYLLLNPGTTADTGYNIQWNVADVPSSLMQFLSTPNTAISAGRDIYFGIRCAFAGETTTWDGKVFMGLAATDTALLTTADGTITQTTMDQGVGIHIGEAGAITLTATETTGNSISTDAFSVDNLGVTAINMASSFNGQPMCLGSNSVVQSCFHDYFFHAHWAATDATGTGSFVEAYFDGKLVASITGSAKLPNLTAGDLFPSIEILNGGTRDCDMFIAEILVATPRLHIA